MRSAEFDRDAVLRSAMEAFLVKGYSKTSMQDLKQATGLHPGSIYCAFTNKRGLLIAALQHYREERNAEQQTLFAAHPTVMAGIEAYLDQVVAECEQENIKDCLLQKALNELAQQDEEVESIISKMLTEWQESFTALIQKALLNQELQSSRSPEQLARFLVMGIYGLRTFSHTKPAAGVLRQLSAELLRAIRH